MPIGRPRGDVSSGGALSIAHAHKATTMTFKYSVTLPISGGNKLRRFRQWVEHHLPDLSYSLPQQTPIKTEVMTIRLLSLDDRARLLHSWASTQPPGEEGQ